MGGDWGKFNTIYANEEYVDAQRKELRRFTGRMSRGEWIAVVLVLLPVVSVTCGIAWQLLR